MKERVKREGLPMKPGVREILYYLRAVGYRIALASSTRTESVLRHLEQAQIRDCFEVVTGGDRVEHSKPLPDIYLITCRELGVSPQNAVAIEDSPNGIRSAYAAGMHPIMVPDLIAPTPEIQKLLYAECKTLLEVLELFREAAERDGLQEVLRIPLQGLCNTRDLGGYRTADGRRIKNTGFCAAVRSLTPHKRIWRHSAPNMVCGKWLIFVQAQRGRANRIRSCPMFPM